MGMKFIIFLTIGTLAMLIPLSICSKWFEIRIDKTIAIALFLTVIGTTGTYLMGFFENQFRFGNRSFYGAVFLIPVVFILLSRIMRINYGKLMDMSAPAVCTMLVLMKVLCAMEGCCGGCALFKDRNGVMYLFPSQIIELLAALILLWILMRLIGRGAFAERIYPCFMVLYGISRFILNTFRAGITPFFWILPAGHFWSLLSTLVGVAWVYSLTKTMKMKQ